MFSAGRWKSALDLCQQLNTASEGLAVFFFERDYAPAMFAKVIPHLRRGRYQHLTDASQAPSRGLQIGKQPDQALHAELAVLRT